MNRDSFCGIFVISSLVAHCRAAHGTFRATANGQPLSERTIPNNPPAVCAGCCSVGNVSPTYARIMQPWRHLYERLPRFLVSM